MVLKLFEGTSVQRRAQWKRESAALDSNLEAVPTEANGTDPNGTRGR